MEVWRHHRVIGNVVVGALVGVFLVLLLTTTSRTGDNTAATRELVTAIRETQTTNTAVVQDTHATAELIKSCVEPSGDCFRQGQRRTATAVADINRVVILAAACASGLPPGMSVSDRQTRISSCVIDRLAVSGRGAP